MTRVQILYFAGCPAYRRARQRVLEVLRELRLPWDLEMVLVRHERDARDLAFFGSPTVRVDGVDIDPPRAGQTPGLYSRSYTWERGEFDAPPDSMLRSAFGLRRSPPEVGR